MCAGHCLQYDPGKRDNGRMLAYVSTKLVLLSNYAFQAYKQPLDDDMVGLASAGDDGEEGVGVGGGPRWCTGCRNGTWFVSNAN